MAGKRMKGTDMNHAPEKIWIDPTGVDSENMYVSHGSDTMDYLNMDVGYTRDDIAEARLERMKKIFERSRATYHTESCANGVIPAAQIKILTDMDMHWLEQTLREPT
jgi:hypothetical protein